MNRNWYFKFGENTGDEKRITLSNYNLIGLPHSFAIPYYGENDFFVGFGTYYKEFECDYNIEENELLIEFGAVFRLPKYLLTECM